MLTIPHNVRTTFARIKTLFPEAVIAGGYLRDLYFGVVPMDIDVFIECRSGIHAALRHEFGAMCVVEDVPETAADYTGALNAAGIAGVYTVCSGPGLPFQVIAVNAEVGRDQAASRCDFGFCQIATDDCVTFAMSLWFHEDAARNTATCLGRAAPEQMERSKRRAVRLKGRYPERTFVFPDCTI